MRIGALSATYCERAGDPGLWAEPTNAITNLVFLIAGIAVLTAFRRNGLTLRRHADIAALIALVFAIGIGSTFWHTLASRGAELFDVVPILLFILLCLPVMLVRVLHLTAALTAGLFMLFIAVSSAFVATLPPTLWNGSVFYVPTWLAVALVAAELARRRHPHARRLALAALLLAASLFFRSIDHAVCDTVAIGTHFLWHLLNGAVLWLLLSVLTAMAGEIPSHAGTQAKRLRSLSR